MDSPRSGYTLPVFACAAAIAALHRLHELSSVVVTVNLIEPSEMADVTIAQVAEVSINSALAITLSDPGDNLDLTRDTPVWALVERVANQPEPIAILGGEGVGKLADGQPAIYSYARRLLLENLLPLLRSGEQIRVTIILPEGKALAKRTSNEAFGVVEGLSLLGTTGISQPLSAPGQLEAYRHVLRQKVEQFDGLVFCVGENGLDLGQQLGISVDRLVKTANWLGPMLVEAGMQGVKAVLLFGYHGKLLKLAGGIFHTHHHVADGRIEILTAHCAQVGLPTSDVQAIFARQTAEDGLNYLKQLDESGSEWVKTVYGSIAETIDRRAAACIRIHSTANVLVGSVLFDRQRQVVIQSNNGTVLLNRIISSG